MSDPLADVIRGAVAPRHPLPFWLPGMLADAVRAHIAAVLDAEAAKWKYQGQDYLPATHSINNLRATLLGDSGG